MKRLLLFFFVFFSLHQVLFAQSIGVNNDNSAPEPSAMLDVKSSTKGMLVPRLTSSEMNNIVDPVNGLLIYNSQLSSFHFYDGTTWVSLSSTQSNILVDEDNDTKIQVEESSDEDIIRFDVGSAELLRMRNNIGAEKQLLLEPVGSFRSTFFGYEAGLNNEATPLPSGFDNTYIGYNAGKSSSFTNENTFVGSQAGEDNNEGIRNTLLGYRAGQIIYDGSENTFIGHGAGGEIEDANNNTYIGYEAGHRSGGNSNVHIGYKAGRNFSGNNKLAIANSETNNPLIYGEFNNNYLRMNGTQSISDDFIIGRENLPANGIDIADTLQFFDVSKGAFRAGISDGAKNWSPDSLGIASFSFGNSNRAKGELSAVWGISNRATASQTTTWGILNRATAYNATVWGSNSEANGSSSTSWGSSCDANGRNSTVWGANNVASSGYETVFGRYATIKASLDDDGWNENDRLLAIGNGINSVNRSDAFEIYKNGDTNLNGELTIVSNDTINRLNLYPNASTSEDNSSVFFGEDDNGSYGMEIRYNGTDNQLEFYGKSNSTIYGKHITIKRNSGSITFGDDKFIFNPNVNNKSRFTTDELEIRGGSDLAENFDIVEKEIQAIPGMLVSIDKQHAGKLILTSDPYCPLLAGVISGAEGIDPGMRMGQKGTLADGEYPITLTGRVYIKVNDEGGEITIGDVITSSSITGEGMKANHTKIKYGTCIGKALSAPNENGFALVLVNLQ